MDFKKTDFKIAVSAPGKFDLFRWAEGFESEGVLEKLYTDFFAPAGSFLSKLRLDSEQIPQSKILTNIYPRLFRLIARRFLKNSNYYEGMLFDRWVAKNLESPDVFIGRSGTSLSSIASAKEKNIKTVLYRGSSHIQFQDSILREEYEKFGVPFFGATPKYIQRELEEYKICDLFYVPSSYAASTYLSKGIASEKIIHFPLSAELFPKDNIDSNKKEKFAVLYVGNISLGKGCQYLLDAAKILESEKNIEFIFVGGVDRSMTKIIGRGVPNNVKIIGKIPHREIGDYYKQASVFCFPTIDDGFGQVILESLDFGVPVIATNHSGAPDIIRGEDCGYLTPIRNSEYIAEKILFLYNNEDVRMNMAAVGQKRSREYSVNNFIKKWKMELKEKFG